MISMLVNSLRVHKHAPMSMIHSMPGHLIRRLHQISTALFQERMIAMGLDLTPVQYGALAVLSENPGIDQARLAGLIAYDRATIGGVVDRLQAKGLIRRRVSPRDRRARELALTREGAALLARVTPEVRAVQAEILPGLTEAERTAFLALAARATEAGNTLSRAPQVPLD
jgi:MarR family transcriptional regulator, temperature-dependent positive regulator of motility